ncbi:MAG: hypothetical protein ACR2N3_04025 [Pyrinomonadaceae bacterium]
MPEIYSAKTFTNGTRAAQVFCQKNSLFLVEQRIFILRKLLETVKRRES